MGMGPKKHQKRLSAPSHWLLDKLSGMLDSRNRCAFDIAKT
jgi:small subunit ribosomal protein S4e